jgi:hypothetical protein
VLALLACAYSVAYFAVLPRLRVVGPRTTSFARHAAVVGLVHGLVLLPFEPRPTTLVVVGTAAIAHAAIDRLAGRARRSERGIESLLLELVAHLAWVAALAWWMPSDVSAETQRALLFVAVVAFNGPGAAAIVGAALAPLQAEGTDDGPIGAGRRIGMLERWMIVGLVAMGEWGAVGLVLTAKSVARFRRMDEQAFAEIYLVGTMTSVLIAMATGWLLRLVG